MYGSPVKEERKVFGKLKAYIDTLSKKSGNYTAAALLWRSIEVYQCREICTSTLKKVGPFASSTIGGKKSGLIKKKDDTQQDDTQQDDTHADFIEKTKSLLSGDKKKLYGLLEGAYNDAEVWCYLGIIVQFKEYLASLVERKDQLEKLIVEYTLYTTQGQCFACRAGEKYLNKRLFDIAREELPSAVIFFIRSEENTFKGVFNPQRDQKYVLKSQDIDEKFHARTRYMHKKSSVISSQDKGNFDRFSLLPKMVKAQNKHPPYAGVFGARKTLRELNENATTESKNSSKVLREEVLHEKMLHKEDVYINYRRDNKILTHSSIYPEIIDEALRSEINELFNNHIIETLDIDFVN